METAVHHTHEPDDAELFRRARAGDHQALGDLVDRHKDALVNYLTRISGRRETAEDTAQETFLKLLQHSDRYVERGRLLPYIYRIATNLVRSEQRRNQRWRLLHPRLLAGSERSAPPAQHHGMERRQLGKVLTGALAQLPSRYRVPVVLRDIEGWAYSEIADVLGVRPGTVKSRLHRGRALLRDLVRPHWNGVSS